MSPPPTDPAKIAALASLRRFRRWFWRITGALVLIFAAIVLRYAYAKPYRDPAFTAEYIALFSNPAGINLDGYPILTRCDERLGAMVDALGEQGAAHFAFDPIYDPRWRDHTGERDQAEALARTVVANVNASDLPDDLQRLIHADGYTRPAGEGPLGMWSLADIGSARFLARLSRARMHIAAEVEDWKAFVDSYEVMLAMSRLLSQRGTSTEARLSAALLPFANAELRYTLLESSLPQTVLDALSAAMQRQQAGCCKYASIIAGDRLETLDMLGAMHTRGGTFLISEEVKLGESAQFFGVPAEHAHWLNAIGLFFPSRQTSMGLLEEFCAFHARTIDVPVHLLPPEDADRIAYGDALPQNNYAIALAIPDFAKTSRAIASSRTDHAATVVMLALASHRARHGDYPDSLSDLNGKHGHDPMTGKPFGYRRSDNASTPYVLYAWGLDQTDDGGAAPQKPSDHFQPLLSRKADGLDVLFSRARDQ